MSAFIEYISDLLLLHDCVIIPDFGGFICNYKSAKIDEVSGMIYPPTKEIIFNRNLKHNDGLLINWIAEKEHIDYEKATKQVAFFTEELKIKLNQYKNFTFGDIGTFYTDRRYNINFKAGDTNFLADTWGMEAIEIPERIVEEKKSAPSQTNIPVSNDMPPYINMEPRTWFHRLLNYGIAAAIIAGIIFISHVSMLYWNESDNIITSMTQPTLPQFNPTPRPDHVTISPNYDYVNYDPLEKQ